MSNLRYLINNFRKSNISWNTPLFKYQHCLKEYTAPDWKNYVDKDRINEFQKNLIHRDKNFEIFLIHWPKDYISQIHNHSSNGCLLKMLEGNLVERIYSPQLDFLDEYYRYSQEISYLDNKIGYHSIENISNKNSNSIHIYSPPLHETEYYNI